MSEDAKIIRQMAFDGMCCSQIIIAMALRFKGESNPAMIDGARGLCRGLYTGKICGILSASAFALALFDPENAKNMLSQLFEWYEESCAEQYGGESCLEISAGEPKLEVCLDLLIKTWDCVKSILTEYGFEEAAA